MRRVSGTTALLVALVLLSACATLRPQPQQELRRGEVQRGTITALVSATGTLLPEEQVNLVFDQPGIVAAVYVEAGDVVQAGQLLAQLDARRLEVAVRQAELALEAQQLAYDRLFLAPSSAEVGAASASIQAAQANLAQVTQGPDAETVRAAELEYERAYNAYVQADMQVRAVQWYLPEEQLVPFREQANQALIQVEVARLRLEQLRAGPDQYAVAAAQAGVNQAQADLGAVLEGPSDVEVARAQVQIDQAQLSLDRALSLLATTALYAPMTGVVAEVAITPGAIAPANRPAITLLDASRLHVQIGIDELDIGRVTVGQPARVTLEALPDALVEGQVASIAAAATSTAGVVAYDARIDLAQTDLPLRIGMTATVEIIVQQLDDVLLVPNWAIRLDRSTRQAYVSVLGPDGVTLQEFPVTLGLRGDAVSQVVAGVTEGQVVAVSVSSESLDLFGGGQ